MKENASEKTKPTQFSFFTVETKPKVASPSSEAVSVAEKAKIHSVTSGDTLGSIAIQFYDSSNPKYIEKIRNANNLTDADTLSIGQRLVIPPKTY